MLKYFMRRGFAYKLSVLSVFALIACTLIFGLRPFASFSPLLHAASEEYDISVPYRYISVGWVDWATVQLKEMTEVADPDAEALFLLAMAHESLGDLTSALEAYHRIERTFPHQPGWLAKAKALAGMAKLRLGQYEDARVLLLQANRLKGDQALVTYGLGAIAEQRGDLDGALEWYRQSVDASKEWVDPAVRAASVYLHQGAPVKAVTLLLPYEGMASRDPAYHYELGTAYAMLAEHGRSGDLDQHELEELESVAIVGDDLVITFVELAHHALDRIRQLDPEHPSVTSLTNMIESLP